MIYRAKLLGIIIFISAFQVQPLVTKQKKKTATACQSKFKQQPEALFFSKHCKLQGTYPPPLFHPPKNVYPLYEAQIPPPPLTSVFTKTNGKRAVPLWQPVSASVS